MIRQFIGAFFTSLVGAFCFTYSPLYRYPYRNSGEGLRGDWQRIGKDVSATIEGMYEQ